MDDLLEKLRAPFPADVVSWRVGSTNKRAWERDNSKPKRGQVLAYIDARDVMERLDEVCGTFGWQCEYVPMPNGTTCCRIGIQVFEGGMSSGIYVPPAWVWKSNGAGATDIEGEKGGYSDAFKRAAVLWGVGRYLYDLSAPWISLTDYWSIPDSELPALRRLLTGEKAPSARSTREQYGEAEKKLRGAETLKALQGTWTSLQPIIGEWPDGHRQKITEEKDRCKDVLLKQHEEAA
jgi:hypothetical protein